MAVDVSYHAKLQRTTSGFVRMALESHIERKLSRGISPAHMRMCMGPWYPRVAALPHVERWIAGAREPKSLHAKKWLTFPRAPQEWFQACESIVRIPFSSLRYHNQLIQRGVGGHQPRCIRNSAGAGGSQSSIRQHGSRRH